MEEFTATTIFWLISLGALTGFVVNYILGSLGVKLLTNVIGGIIGSTVAGVIALGIDLPGTLLFSFLGCMAILFLMNIFNFQKEGSHETSEGVRRT